MKKVLFIIGTLQSGGVSKSMVNLLNTWDYSRFDTTLLLCCKRGNVFQDMLPAQVKLLYDARIEHAMGGFSSALWFFKRGRLLHALGVLLRLVLSQLSKALAGELIAKMMPKVTNEQYDLIVDYGGQQILYYMVNKLEGKQKISFFHNDYSKWSYYYKADKKYLPLVEGVFTISETCADSLRQWFPEIASKVHIIENINSPKVISKLADAYQVPPFDGFTMVTVGHFSKVKGADLAIEVAQKLKQRSIHFRWLFIGKVLDTELAERVKAKGLDDVMKLEGIHTNPYPYVKAANIFVHLARFEGKAIALDEAKILCKPIVVTKFSTVFDQFTDGVNATICEFDTDKIADAIVALLNDEALQKQYSTYLEQHIIDNSSEVEKFYQLIG